jgi:hypothetical protein
MRRVTLLLEAGLEQLGVGGHRGEAVDSVTSGHSGCTTGLGIGYLWAVGRRVANKNVRHWWCTGLVSCWV